jgi:hypothetical protein
MRFTTTVTTDGRLRLTFVSVLGLPNARHEAEQGVQPDPLPDGPEDLAS